MHFYSLYVPSSNPTATGTGWFCTFINFQRKEILTIFTYVNKRHYQRALSVKLTWLPPQQVTDYLRHAALVRRYFSMIGEHHPLSGHGSLLSPS